MKNASFAWISGILGACWTGLQEAKPVISTQRCEVPQVDEKGGLGFQDKVREGEAALVMGVLLRLVLISEELSGHGRPQP